jgi:hypothetical protein
MVVQQQESSGSTSISGTTSYWRYALIALLPLLFIKGIIIDRAILRTESMESMEGIALDRTVVTTAQSLWDKAVLEAQDLLSKNASKAALQLLSNDVWDATVREQILPSCLVPNLAGTAAVVEDAVATQRNISPISGKGSSLVPLPVLNVGMPKCGSTTLYSFFQCVRFQVSHWSRNNLESQNFRQDYEGLCMRDAARVGLPPLATCAGNKDALMQMDFASPFGSAKFCKKKNRDNCFFPQLSLLEEIHAESPNATFVMNFRPIRDWVHSVRGWTDFMKRFQKCHLPNLPRGFPENLDDRKGVEESMTQFFCSHVLHVRQFVELHPSHALIELDLYDTEGTASVMDALFASSSSAGKNESQKCWGHANLSKKKKNANG